jgi:two-component system, NarL family, sensor histidine kinase UhpB
LLRQALVNGYRGRFYNAQDLIDELYASLADHSTTRVLKRLAAYDLLVLDELGYMNLKPEHANALFQLLEQRYARKSTLITTNLDFEQWYGLFRNKPLVDACSIACSTTASSCAWPDPPCALQSPPQTAPPADPHPPIRSAVAPRLLMNRGATAACHNPRQLLLAVQSCAPGGFISVSTTGAFSISVEGYAPRSFEPSHGRLMERIHPADRRPIERRLREVIERETGFGLEFRVIRPNGEERFVRARGEILRDAGGKSRAMLGTLLDFTAHRRNEIALEKSRETLRELAAHLQTVREEQRAEIAREIHDEMGQGLTAMKIDLVRLRSRLRGQGAPVSELVGSLLVSLDTTIAAVQRIMAELRPAVLDDLGLVPAIEWLSRQFTERTGIGCRLDLPETQLALAHDARTALFRILQESLTNVARHAGATQVRVTLDREGQSIRLLVEDDGKGIRTVDLESGRSFGLLGMRERAAVFGGTLTIHGEAGVGTRVCVAIPATAGTGG